ncbi:helix-turn-helix domain-containing protein [Aquitalea denitrificans]|uniref:helix-turn-helix domain-containing protein n=1 Tax=Aquitalea denitrificans TaxID=519081 RepID=UPI00135BFB64
MKQSQSLHTPSLANLIATGCDLLQTNEAAELLRFKPQTLRRWACYDTGPIRPVRVAGKLRWRLSDISMLMSGVTPQ